MLPNQFVQNNGRQGWAVADREQLGFVILPWIINFEKCCSSLLNLHLLRPPSVSGKHWMGEPIGEINSKSSWSWRWSSAPDFSSLIKFECYRGSRPLGTHWEGSVNKGQQRPWWVHSEWDGDGRGDRAWHSTCLESSTFWGSALARGAATWLRNLIISYVSPLVSRLRQRNWIGVREGFWAMTKNTPT